MVTSGSYRIIREVVMLWFEFVQFYFKAFVMTFLKLMAIKIPVVAGIRFLLLSFFLSASLMAVLVSVW